MNERLLIVLLPQLPKIKNLGFCQNREKLKPRFSMWPSLGFAQFNYAVYDQVEILYHIIKSITYCNMRTYVYNVITEIMFELTRSHRIMKPISCNFTNQFEPHIILKEVQMQNWTEPKLQFYHNNETETNKLLVSPNRNSTTLWTEKQHTQMFLSYLKRNPADPNKIWCVLFWVNSPHSNVNASHLTWIMSLHYLVKLSVHNL